MTEIVLYGVPVSCFVAKVRIVLEVKGLRYREAPPPDGYGSLAYRALVPAGSVPALLVDGAPLHDSNSILEFLEEIAPDPALLPIDPLDRGYVRSLLGFHDTRLEAAARQLFPVVKSDWRKNPESAEPGLAAIRGALERLEQLIDPTPFVMGPDVSLADLAYPCTLQMAQMLAEEVEQPIKTTDVIGAWVAEVSKIAPVSRSLEITRAAMDDWLAQFRA